MLVYRIKRKKDGLFMTKRGSFPAWTEDGHIYNTVQGCRSAIKTRINRWWNEDPPTVDIVEYELVETGNKFPVKGKK